MGLREKGDRFIFKKINLSPFGHIIYIRCKMNKRGGISHEKDNSNR